MIDDSIPWIPEIQVVDENGKLLGTSSQVCPVQRKVDIAILRSGTTAIQQSNIQSAAIDMIPAEPEILTEPETAANDRRMSVIIRTPKTQGNRKVTVTDISPLPTLCMTAGPTKVTKRRTSKAAILTGSPYKRQLEEDQNQKNKTAKKAKKPKQTTAKDTSGGNKPSSRKSQVAKAKRQAKVDDDDDISGWFCKLCDECVREDMIQCEQCNVWVHSECAGVSTRARHFVCDFCRPN